MMAKSGFVLFLSSLLILFSCGAPKDLTGPLHLTKSTTFFSKTYFIHTASLGGRPCLTVEGDNLEIDFQQAVLDGRQKDSLPDAFEGIAIYVHDCKNVTIKNVSIHGFKIAILAERVENLQILDCDLSYNYRPKLLSKWNRESLADWLYYHQNEKEEWQRYGAAIYLKDCANALVKGVTSRQGMNGLLMTRCHHALVYNNTFSFNSGLGIGLYRSGHNRIMHNRLDWNARGYSHGQYARGQDSAAILLYEQSSHNIIAFNSATHSGDGLFLWAGQSTMDTGVGGCDSNMIYKNDFSHSIANAIEVTFSVNYMIDNILDDSRYGIWGGYSHHSVIRGNQIRGCETGIAIEHGRYIVIDSNDLRDCQKGLEIWNRESQPADWPYAQKTDVQGRQYRIIHNSMTRGDVFLETRGTDSIWYAQNTLQDVKKEFSFPGATSYFMYSGKLASWMPISVQRPAPLVDGMAVSLPADQPRGRKYILVNEWGPYDFQYPILALRRKETTGILEKLYLDLLGPPGTWQIDQVEGCSFPSNTTGTFPDSLVILCNQKSETHRLNLRYAGPPFRTQTGETIPMGQPYSFGYVASAVPLTWEMAYFTYDTLQDPLVHPEAFTKMLLGRPAKTVTVHELAFRWWGKPAEELPADRFAVTASAGVNLRDKEYRLEVESDDGIRVWLDDRIILERWDAHTPTVDEVRIRPGAGYHEVRVDYFENGGLGVLDVSLAPE